MSSKTVHKALDVLEMFTNETPSWGLRELARAMGLNHTVVHRILTTFEERGYLFRHPESQKYELGLGIVQLSELVDERYQLSSKLDIIMKRITHETNESSVFTVLDNDHGVFLKIVESSQKVRFAESVGRRSPLYVGASHKSILAYLPSERQKKIVQHAVLQQPERALSTDQMYEFLSHIRKQGWAYTAGETFEDVAAVAIPIFTENEKILGSLSIAGPVYRFSEEEAAKKVQILQKYQLEIQSFLGRSAIPTISRFIDS